jgi:predicted TIM-barrel fold metal-dependent hydrolase
MTRAIIDTHVHLGTREWLEGSLGPYGASAEAFFGTTFAPVTVEDMAARYDELDVTAVLLAWDAERHTGRPGVSSATVAGVVARFPDTFIGFGSVDPLRPDALDRVAEVGDLGLAGLKLHPTMQGFDPAADAVLPFFAAVAGAGLRVLTHVGMSALGAQEPGGMGLRLDVARPSRMDRVAAEFPDLNIMLAHLGAPWEAETLAMVLHKANLFTDISGWRLRYLSDAVRRDMRGRLRRQICFGSDYPMFDPGTQLDDFAELGLADDVAADVLGNNARRFLGLD